MPTVPRKTSQEISPVPTPRLNTESNAPIEAFGGGRQVDQTIAAGRDIALRGFEAAETIKAQDLAAIEKANKELAQIQAQAKQDTDRLVAMDADLQLAELQNNIDLDIRNLKGKNSVEAVKVMNDRWKKGVDDINKSLFNQEQKDAVNIAQQKRFLSLNKTVGNHVNTQMEQYAQGLFKSSLQASKEQASINYTDIEFVAEQFQKVEALINTQAERDGRGKEWRDNQLAIAKSGMHGGIIERMLFDGQTELAEQYQESVKDQILSNDLSVIKRAKKESKLARQAQAKENEKQWELGLISGETGPSQIMERFNADPEYKLSDFNRDNNFLQKVWNDPTRNAGEKADAINTLSDMFIEAGGGFDITKGKVTEPVDKDKEQQILDLRAFAMENKDRLPKKVVGDVFRLTEEALDDSRNPKWEILAKIKNVIKEVSVWPIDSNVAFFNAAAKILSPNATIADAQKVAEDTIDAVHPEKSKYPVGTIIYQGETFTYKGRTIVAPRTMTVTGHTDGNPMLDEGAIAIQR